MAKKKTGECVLSKVMWLLMLEVMGIGSLYIWHSAESYSIIHHSPLQSGTE